MFSRVLPELTAACQEAHLEKYPPATPDVLIVSTISIPETMTASICMDAFILCCIKRTVNADAARLTRILIRTRAVTRRARTGLALNMTRKYRTAMIIWTAAGTILSNRAWVTEEVRESLPMSSAGLLCIKKSKGRHKRCPNSSMFCLIPNRPLIR